VVDVVEYNDNVVNVAATDFGFVDSTVRRLRFRREYFDLQPLVMSGCDPAENGSICNL
jgi:hypothetical protein